MLEKKGKMPYYDIEKLIKACKKKTSTVIVLNGNLDKACEFFDLCTISEIVAFIGNGGCENLEFVNTKLWDNNPNKSIEIKVDSYEFTTNNKKGYLAFMYNNKTKKWIIKSFHTAFSDSKDDELYMPFKDLLEEKYE